MRVPESIKWKVAGVGIDAHTFLYRLTGGKIGGRMVGNPILLLEHVGRKSGKRRTTPLLYGEDGKNLFIIASKGGAPRHPAWYHNLMAAPETTIQVGSERRRVRPRRAEGDERQRLWDQIAAAYSGYEGYRKRTDREIPVVVLEPLGDAS